MTSDEISERTWLMSGLHVGESAIGGQGLFTDVPIAIGATVLVYGGTVVEGVPGARSSLALDEYRSLLQADDDAGSYLNHSCDGNLWLTDAVTMVARRPISPGEELSVDYALLSWDPAWHMPCDCRASVCRGVISGDDWRLPELQRRYAGHFSPFLNGSIASTQRR